MLRATWRVGGGVIERLLNWLMKIVGHPDYWLVGKIVEMTGNKASLAGCTFDLDNPVIPTAMKSRFAIRRYEASELLAVQNHLRIDQPVIEFGASIGVLACITNKRLKSPQQHVVLEANPSLIPSLSRYRKENNCQFTVVQAALAYESGQTTFYPQEKFDIGSTQPSAVESITVPTVTLRGLINRYQFKVCNLICDIEGSEYDLITHELLVLAEHVNLLIIEVHLQQTVNDFMHHELLSVGFEKIARYWHVLVYQNCRLNPGKQLSAQ